MRCETIRSVTRWVQSMGRVHAYVAAGAAALLDFISAADLPVYLTPPGVTRTWYQWGTLSICGTFMSQRLPFEIKSCSRPRSCVFAGL